MDRRVINPWSWQERAGFVHAHEAAGTCRVLYCAGAASVDGDGSPIHHGDMEAQGLQALDNLETILTAAGYTLGDVVRLNTYVTDIDAYANARRALQQRLDAAGCRYAATLLGVGRLARPELLIELEATAAQMTTLTNVSASVESLGDQLTGTVLTPGAPGWDAEVASFNCAVTHTPDLVIAAATAADVQAAMSYAAAHDLAVGVQATGHGAVIAIDHGLLVSTRGLDSVDIDPLARTATVGAGVRWRAVIDRAAPYGLAPLNGSSSDVGVVGFTLGGGLPVMGRAFGFAADHVISADVVTADGQLRHVDADSEPELFWALRGGKGNVGIVISLTFRLVAVNTVYGGGVFFAAEHIPAVLLAYRQWSPTLPEPTCTSLAVLRLPPIPEIPEPLRGRTVAHLRVCHIGDAETGAGLVAPMRAVAPPLIDTLADMPYTAIDAIHQDPEHPMPAYERNVLLRELTPDAIDILLARVGPEVTSPISLCEIRHLGGALSRAPDIPDAVTGRDAAYAVITIGALAPHVADIVPGAIDGLITSLAPWSTGSSLVNLHGQPGDETDRSRAWDPATYQRLRALVAQVDPDRRLRFGHAIACSPSLTGFE